jgi:hypothetical protein
MSTFSSFLDRLPDPLNPIGEDGSSVNSTVAGPGFKTVKFTSQQPVAVSRTNSGRVITRSVVGHKWNIGITYNPMTRDQFEPVYNFLLEKRGRLKPFFVALPQYGGDSTNSSSDPSTRTAFTGTIRVNGTITAGDDNFLVDGINSLNPSGSGLRPGDVFTFNDTTNSNHKKVYQVVRVNTSTNKLTSDSALNNTDFRRYYVVPSVEKDVADNAQLTYINPLFRVIQTSDIQEYSLGVNNLYTFSLNLEEAQP